MKRNSFVSFKTRWVITSLLTLCFLTAWSQQNLGRQTILQFDANSSVLKPEAPPLKESVPMEKGRGNPLFL
ncbi:MAG: hypothetical protein WCK09_21335 [Bacteroidota bacterium]